MLFSRSTWGMERQQTSTLGKCQVPSGISKKYIGMPSATKLFQEYVEKITSMRDKEPVEGIPKRYGIGTSRLYKIWKNAQKSPIQRRSRHPSSRSHASSLDSLSGKIDKMLAKQKDLQKQVDVPAFCSKYKKATFRTWKTSTKRSKWAERLHDTIESTSNVFLEDTEIVSASQAASAGIYCYRLYLLVCFMEATKDTGCPF